MAICWWAGLTLENNRMLILGNIKKEDPTYQDGWIMNCMIILIDDTELDSLYGTK